MGHRPGLRGPAAGPALVGVCAVVGLSGVIRASRPLLNGPDPFWHWDLGRRIVAARALPTADPYSFLTEGRDWVLNQWGTDLLIGLVTRAGGLPLLAFVTAVVVAVGVGLTGREMWQRAPSLLTVPLLGLVMLTSMSSWVLRGTLATLVLLPLLLREVHRSDPRPWLLGVLFLLWANLHAAFLIGIALVAIDTVARVAVADPGERRSVAKRGATAFGAALVAPLVNPYGPRYVAEVFSLAAGGTGTGISEWAPPAILSLRFLPFTVLAALVLVAVAVSGRRADLPDILLVVSGTFIGLTAQRNAALGAVIVGVTGAPYVLRAWHEHRDDTAVPPTSPVGRIDGAIAAALAVASLAILIGTIPRSGALSDHSEGVPLRLIGELDALERPVRLATSATWAPAVAALTQHHVQTEVDGRAELFDAEERAMHIALHRGAAGWDKTLNRWCITDALVPSRGPLHTTLQRSNEWNPAGIDHAEDRENSELWFTRRELPAHC